MLALTVRHPYALGIALGLKPIENRSKSLGAHRHVGERIAIHASKEIPKNATAILDDLAVRVVWTSKPGLDRVSLILEECERTRGCVLATATLARVIEHGDNDPLNDSPWRDLRVIEGRFAFVLADVVRLEKPFPAKGSLGFWPLPYSAEEALYVAASSEMRSRP